MYLSKEGFEKARNYIFNNAASIDIEWFEYNFVHHDADIFIKALEKHQFENGGFGGLFHEFDYQGPCLKSTETAVWYILNLEEKPSSDLPIIQKMMNYILEQFIPGIGNWGDVAVPEVNDGVHCRWVRYRGNGITYIEDVNERIKNYNANEKACFAAFVAYYSEIVPEELYRAIIKYPIEHIIRYWDNKSPDFRKSIFIEGEPYEFEYFQWFVHCLSEKEVANKLTIILRQNPACFMELDYARSKNDYVHLPCDLISFPDNVIYPVVKNIVHDSLEYRMKLQSQDGRWALGWSLGSGKEFQKLQILYEANRTVAMLVKLKLFAGYTV